MNLIPKIAEMLGVEIGEIFELTFAKDGTVLGQAKFVEKGVVEKVNYTDSGWDCSINPSILNGLLDGLYGINKLPFEPKEEEEYWIVYWDVNGKKICTTNLVWRNYVSCFTDKYCGNCFRTKAEAEAHKYEIYETLTGKKWEDE